MLLRRSKVVRDGCVGRRTLGGAGLLSGVHHPQLRGRILLAAPTAEAAARRRWRGLVLVVALAVLFIIAIADEHDLLVVAVAAACLLRESLLSYATIMLARFEDFRDRALARHPRSLTLSPLAASVEHGRSLRRFLLFLL